MLQLVRSRALPLLHFSTQRRSGKENSNIPLLHPVTIVQQMPSMICKLLDVTECKTPHSYTPTGLNQQNLISQYTTIQASFGMQVANTYPAMCQFPLLVTLYDHNVPTSQIDIKYCKYLMSCYQLNCIRISEIRLHILLLFYSTLNKQNTDTDHHVQQANVICLSSHYSSFSGELDNKMTPLCHADAVNNKIHVM